MATEIETIGIVETAPGCFRLSYNGRVLGDSRGYSRDQAITEARKATGRLYDNGDWLNGTWYARPTLTVLDPALDAAPAEPRAVTARKAALAAIAAQHGIPTIEVRNSDSLDFHELHVGTIADMLAAAYAAGKAAK